MAHINTDTVRHPGETIVITGNTLVRDNGHYYLNIVAAVTITLDRSVKCFDLTDYEATISDTNTVDIVCGVDTLRLGLAEAGQSFKLIRTGNVYRIYDKDGIRAEGDIT